VSTVGAEVGDAAGQPSAPRPAGGRGSQFRRWWVAAAALLVVIAATAAALIQRSWATAHQPITWGCCEQSPTGAGLRAVNTFAHYREDIYVPPQRGTFVIFTTIRNAGSRPVRIGKLTLQADGTPRLAGPVRYSHRFLQPQLAALRHLPILRNVTLPAGGGLFLAIPLQTSPCASKGGWRIDPSFYLTERSMLFTRTVALPWTMNGGALIMRPSAGRRPSSGSFCAAK
jgi:hypothetical protein